MSLDYDLYLAGDRKPVELAAFLAALPGVKADGQRFEALGITGGGLPVGDNLRSMVRKAVGVVVSTQIYFRVDLSVYTDEEGYLGMGTIMRTVFAILGQTPDDALFLFNGGECLFVRRSGKLVFNAASGFWKDDRFKGLITVPFELAELPSSL